MEDPNSRNSYPHDANSNSKPSEVTQEAVWERQLLLLDKMVMSFIKEQRARRRWGIFFKLAFLGLIVSAFLISSGVGNSEAIAEGGKHTALVNLQGVIEAEGDANAERLIASLQSAFEDKGTAGVILRINSPGGSPVQAGIIHDEIKRLRGKHPETPLYVVVEDICASGGYYVAVAADKIFVDKASLVGSIGVLMDGFGFTGTMEKLGIERRLLTAGDNKGMLDPFSPQDARQKEYTQAMLNEIHQQFIDVVRAGRAKKNLKESPEIFSGLVWTGAKSIELGLADGYGTVDSVARDVIKAEKVVDYSVKENLAERFAKRLGVDMAKSLILQLSGSGTAVR